MEDDAVIDRNPNLDHAQWKFLLTTKDSVCADKAAVKEKLMSAIKENNMAPFYQNLCDTFQWPVDAELLATLQSNNAATLLALNEKIDDAEKNLGESELREALLARAEYLVRIGEKDKAVTALRQAYEKTVALGQRLDIVFMQLRIGFFFSDHDLVTRNLEKAKELVEQGGDWDRKNRLKVYEGLHMMATRRFSEAARLFLEALSTFTSYELFDYDTFVIYAVLMSLIALDRVKLKEKAIDSPEILQVAHNVPALPDFLNALYNCNYRSFFLALTTQVERIQQDRFLAPHARFYFREMRITAYAQLLQSYQSVKLATMASAFGLSEEFLDKELSRFIAIGRLACKIDKVGGIVDTTRSDAKNAQYQATIKQGDLLLNRIQKLSRIINA